MGPGRGVTINSDEKTRRVTKKNDNMAGCPNCGTELKSGILSSVSLLPEKTVMLINEYTEPKAQAYCTKCGAAPLAKAKTELVHEQSTIALKMPQLIDAVPVVSAQGPHGWDYQVLDMVTGQSVTGTGVISEFTSSFADMFGAQSGRMNRKLKAGEDLCFAQLRKQALDLGGNAVIATDIDYSEVGGDKGMLMVCMAGTAVVVKNPAVFGFAKSDRIDQLVRLNDRMKYLRMLE